MSFCSSDIVTHDVFQISVASDARGVLSGVGVAVSDHSAGRDGGYTHSEYSQSNGNAHRDSRTHARRHLLPGTLGGY